MAKVAKHPKNIPSAYYKSIGQIIVRWGFTELYLQSVIWHIFKITDVKSARALTWSLNAVDKVKLFGALSPRWVPDPDDQKEVKEIYDIADRLRANRNLLAHAVWGYLPSKKDEMLTFFLRDLDKRINPKAKPLSIKEVKQWAADIDALNKRLMLFHKKIGAPAP